MKTLKELRAEAGLTQTAVAKQMGVSHDSIKRWENGETAPKIDQAVTLAKVYGVGIDEIAEAAAESIVENAESPEEAQRIADEVRTADPENQSMKVTEDGKELPQDAE